MREVRRGRARDPRLPAQARVMLVHGKCHCGNISFSLTWEPDPAEIPARACTCSFCTKHGGVWTSSPGGSLEVVVKDPSLFCRVSASFDGEGEGSRLARRKHNWIADVAYTEIGT